MSEQLEDMKNKQLLDLIIELIDLPIKAELKVIGHNSSQVELYIKEGEHHTSMRVDRNRMLLDPIYLIAKVRQLLINLAVLKGVTYSNE